MAPYFTMAEKKRAFVSRQFGAFSDRVKPLTFQDRRIITSMAAAAVMTPAARCYANGYNKISHIAIPLLVIIFALLYGIIAPFPALAVYLIARLAGKRPRFSPLYLGSFLGGEAGILACVALAKILAADGGWNSYHYTLYPWVILGLSLAGASIGLFLDRRPGKE